MEPQEKIIYCCDNRKYEKKTNCLGIVAVILLALFTFVIGLLIGAALALIVLISLPAIIVLAIVLGLLLLLTVILMICKKPKCENKKCCN